MLLPSIFLCLGMAATPAIEQQIVNEVHFYNKSEYKLPISSWIYMGLNSQTDGTYSENDINRIEKIPKAKRSDETFKLIQQRVKKMGPVKLLSQWVSKIEICENVGTVQGAYMSGNYAAPSWFLYFQDLLSNVSSVLFRSVVILMMLKIIKKLYYRRFSNAWWGMLIQLTLLGFIAFYGLVWETECRYGLVLIPLYLVLLLLPVTDRNCQITVKFSHTAKIIFNGLILGFLVLNLFTQRLSKNINNFSGIVVSQNSQLSNKYSAKNYQMKSETQLTEKVDLKRSANHFSMVVPAKSKVKVELINKTTLKKYKLVRKGNTAFYNGKITARAFQIKVINSTRKSQLCTMINPKSYRLANYAVNGSPNVHNGYFIYSFENRRSLK